MTNPSLSEIWAHVGQSAPLIREGDLRGIGEMDQWLSELATPETQAAASPMRQMLAQLTTAEGQSFQDLHSRLKTYIQDGLSAPGTPAAPGPAAAATPAFFTDAESKANAAPIDKELFMEFVEESLLHLQSIELNVLSLESDPGNRTFVDNIFRPFHTIKGVAGFLSLKPIHEVCHDLESLLDHARQGRMRVAGPVSDLVLESVDFIRSMIESCRGASDPLVSLGPFLPRIKPFLARVTEVGKRALDSASAPKAAPGGPTAPSSTPAAAPRPATAVPSHISVEAMSNDPAEAATAPAPAESAPSTHLEPAAEGHNEGPAAPQGDGRKALGTGDSGESIRVRVGLLNQLMNLAGEMVLGRNQLMQRLAGVSDGIPGLNTVLQHVDRVTSEVQEAVMQTRMQPVGTLFSRFHRVTRDLARSLNKQIDLTLVGETVELDKSLIEALTDPLTHLIRNCSDHGIETPDVRTKRGKRAAGTITLSAHQEGGKVRVIVSDDGAGVNIERVKQKALEKALITREQAQGMSERDVLQLLFAAGFSTAETVTGVSGRGVGMDVVRENVSRIGGTVEIETAAGEGTTFYLDLPLTLAIIPALIVTASGQRFAIPQVNLLELVHLDGNEATSDLLHVGDTEVYRLRGTMLPIVRLGPVLGMERVADEQGSTAISIAVVAAGNKQYGLVVDRIHDTEEIVVKPLGHLLKNLPVYAGATLMGDGRPALILDMAGVAKTANITLQEEKGFDSRATDQQTQAATDEQTLLLFSVSEGDQFAVPLSLLSRLEEVPADRITTSLQGKVIPYRGRLLPLVMLEDILAVSPPAQREKMTILVFEIEREVGLVATRIVDAVKASVTLDSDAIATKGITGLALVQDRPTSFIDIYQIIEMAYPHWFKHDRSTRRKSVESGQVTILLAEDSSFYRTVEKNYLVQSGFNVVEAEDGERALELLKTVRVDLVITDIEMPKLDGFMLTRRIRENPKLHDLPVIAVTSLATEADRQTGLQAGVNSYLVKLQREQLLQEVTRLLSIPEQPLAQKVS